MTAGNAHEGDELYQDTMLTLLEHLDRLDEKNNSKSYALSVAIRLWKNRRRKFAWRMRIAPQERARVTNRAGDGMLFEMTEETGPMVFSALPYTPHEIENAMHPYELPPVHYTVVRVAKAQMGVGGDDSWGAQTHPEYLLSLIHISEPTRH